MKWLGILLIVAAISCASFGGLIIDRGYGPQWVGIALISVSLAIAGFAYFQRVAREKGPRAPR
ncbi:MAG: hypothetical protein KKE79_07675 [Actinobacteria bacterium]|nr:hypothetical protein [Actinomycetota bacterium]MCG2795539.1 hypothetical protein [Actinomycetes bacterium]